MKEFNFDLQRFLEYESLNNRNTRFVISYNDEGFGIIRQNYLYVSGKNNYNRFGFSRNDRYSDRNLMYRTKVMITDSSTGKKKDVAIASAAISKNNAMVLTTTGKILVSGRNTCGMLSTLPKGYDPVKNDSWVEITKYPSNSNINNVYMGDGFTILTTNVSGVAFGVGNRSLWDPNGKGLETDTFIQLSNPNNDTIRGIVSVHISKAYVFLLKTDGDVYVYSNGRHPAVGYCNTYILKDNSLETAASTRYVKYEGLSNVIDMDCDDCRAIFVTGDGKVYASGNFNSFNPWGTEITTNNSHKLAQCMTLKDISVVKAKLYGEAIIVIDKKGKMYCIGNNYEGRLIPSNSSSIIKTAVNMNIDLDSNEMQYQHISRDIACFKTLDPQEKGSIFILCGCVCQRPFVYGLGYGSEYGRDKFLTDPDYIYIEKSFTYSDETKIYGSGNVAFIAKPDGVYAAGYNYYGALGTGPTEGIQSVFTKVFNEQVDDIIIGNACTLIRTHGVLFASGFIRGGAINSKTFKLLLFGSKHKDNTVYDAVCPYLNSLTHVIVKTKNGIFAAGPNAHKFIDASKKEGTEIGTFTKIDLFRGYTPEKFFNSCRRNGLFFKLGKNCGSFTNKTLGFGLERLYSGDSDSVDPVDYRTNQEISGLFALDNLGFAELEGVRTGSIVNKVSTLCENLDNVVDVTHYRSTGKTTVVIPGNRGKIRVYARYGKTIGCALNQAHKGSITPVINSTNNDYVIADVSISGKTIKAAYPGDNFIAILTNDGYVYVCGDNPSVGAFCTETKNGIFQVMDGRIKDSQKPISHIEDIRVVHKGLIMLEYVDGKYNVLMLGVFNNGTGGIGLNECNMSCQSPFFFDRNINDEMLIAAGENNLFFVVPPIEYGGSYTSSLFLVGDATQYNVKYSYTSDDIKIHELIRPDDYLNIAGIVVEKKTSIWDDTPAPSVFLIYEDGSVYATGNNSDGRLGLGDTTNRKGFERVLFPGDTEYEVNVRIKKIVLGDGAAGDFTLFLSDDGVVYAAGNAYHGQFGNNYGRYASVASFYTPKVIAGKNVKFNGTDQTVELAGDHIIDIGATYNTSILITSQGEMYYSGYTKSDGQYDSGYKGVLNSNTESVSFTKANIPTTAKKVFAMGRSVFYLHNAFDLYASGSNAFRQLLLGDNASVSFRVAFEKCQLNINHLITLTTMDLGVYHVGLILKGQPILMVGSNGHCRLGSPNKGLTKVFLNEIKDPIKVSCSSTNTLVLTSSGLVYAFGQSFDVVNRSPAYYFSVFPYVIGYVEDDSGSFISNNGLTYYYKIIYTLTEANDLECKYTISIYVGSDVDNETHDINYCNYFKYPTEYTFGRHQVNTIQSTLREAAMSLIGDINTANTIRYKFENVVPELDLIPARYGSYHHESRGNYYYKITATFSNYTPHISKGLTVTIATMYSQTEGKFTTEFTDLGTIPRTVPISGGPNWKTQYASISIDGKNNDIMDKHETKFIDYVKSLPDILGEKITVNTSGFKDKTYESPKTKLKFKYSIDATFDNNNKANAISTTMTLSWTCVCTSKGDKKVKFPYKGTYKVTIKYGNKKDAQTLFKTKANNIIKGCTENGKKITGLEAYLDDWIVPITLPSDFNTYVDYDQNASTSNIKYRITKSVTQEDNKITYKIASVTVLSSYTNKYVNDRKLKITATTATFEDSTKTVTNLASATGTDLLYSIYKDKEGSIPLSSSNYTTIINTIRSKLDGYVNDIKEYLKDKIEYVYAVPKIASFKYQASNESTYTIYVQIKVNQSGEKPFTVSSVSSEIKCYYRKPGATKSTDVGTCIYTTGYKYNSFIKSSTTDTQVFNYTSTGSYKNYKENMLALVKELVSKAINNIGNTVGNIAAKVTTNIQGNYDCGFEGVLYYHAYYRHDKYTPFTTTNPVKCNVYLTYGTKSGNYPNTFKLTTTPSVVTVRPGSNFVADCTALSTALSNAIEEFKKSKKVVTLKAPATEVIGPYVHTIIPNSVSVQYYIRSTYNLKKSNTNSFEYVCTIITKYGLGKKDGDFKYGYRDYDIGNTITINKDNFSEWPNNAKTMAKQIRTSLQNKRLCTYLSSKLENLKPDITNSTIKNYVNKYTAGKDVYTYPTMKVYIESTQLMFDVKIDQSFAWPNEVAERSASVSRTITLSYKRLNETAYTAYSTTAKKIIKISNCSTYVKDLTSQVGGLLKKVDTLLSTFIGDVALPSKNGETYTASTTGVKYCIRHAFTTTYKGATKADVLIQEEWDTTNKYTSVRIWSKSTNHPVTSKNFSTTKTDIKKKADTLRTECKKYLNTLVPPIKESEGTDESGTLTAKTSVNYSYSIDFGIESNTDYTENGVAKIKYDVTWRPESGSIATQKFTTQKTNIDKSNYKTRAKVIANFKTQTIDTLKSYLDTIVPPLENQEDMTEKYTSVTGHEYEITTKFNITTKSNYKTNGENKLTITASWYSIGDNYTNSSTYITTKNFSINKDNFAQRNNILRKDNTTTNKMRAYLDRLLPPIEDEYSNFTEFGDSYKAHTTNTLYFSKTVYKLSGANSQYKKDGTVKINITTYWGTEVDNINRKYTSVDFVIDVSKYIRRSTIIPEQGAIQRKNLEAWLENVLPPVTTLPVSAKELHTYTCNLTKYSYYEETTYALIKQNTDYTHNGAATIEITVKWNTNGTDNYDKSWSGSTTYNITADKYLNMSSNILNAGNDIRSGLNEYLEKLIPPLVSLADVKFPYLANTEVDYYALVDFNIDKDTNFTETPGKITITPKWGREDDKYNNTVDTLKQELEITTNNYYVHEQTIRNMMTNVENNLKNHLDLLLGPIDTIPEYKSEYKISKINGITFRVYVRYIGTYSKYEKNGTFSIGFESSWDGNQNPPERKLAHDSINIAVPDEYKKLKITVGNYSKYLELAQKQAKALEKYVFDYLDSLIGIIDLPSDKPIYEYIAPDSQIHYYLKTSYECEPYTKYSTYNNLYDETKRVKITVTSICGETQSFELGEYVDPEDPEDADFWYDKDTYICNANFENHTAKIREFGELQREQICKKLEYRIGAIYLPGELINAIMSDEFVPEYTASSTGLTYYMKTRYEILPDDSDRYDDIKISTFWSKITDSRGNNNEVTYSRTYPDHLTTDDANTYTIYTITAKNYVKHTNQLREVGNTQRNNFSNSNPGLRQYLETLIGITVTYNKSTDKYYSLFDREIDKEYIDSCIVIPDVRDIEYRTKSTKIFYLQTAYSYGGNASNEDTDETRCLIKYQTKYSPQESFPNDKTTLHKYGYHEITADNFITRYDDLLACSDNDFNEILPVFGIWDVEVPKTETIIYINKGGIAYYISIIYTQGATTDESNTITYKIIYSREHDLNELSSFKFGLCEYLSGSMGFYVKKENEDQYLLLDQESREITDATNTITDFDDFVYDITGTNFVGTEGTSQAIIDEALRYREKLENYLYVPTVYPKETEDFIYVVNDFAYSLRVIFTNTPPENSTEGIQRNVIYVSMTIDGIRYGDIERHEYTRTKEEAQEDMDLIYESKLQYMISLCNYSPKPQSLIVQKNNYFFEVTGTFSKEAGSTMVTIETEIDGVTLYSGALKVQQHEVTARNFLNDLDDCVQNVYAYVYLVEENIVDLPFNTIEGFTHYNETENYSVLEVLYYKSPGIGIYTYDVKCDNVIMNDYNQVEVDMYPQGEVNLMVYHFSEIVLANKNNTINDIFTVLQAEHKLYNTVITNKDGLNFGFRYEIEKEGMATEAIVTTYVDEKLYRQYVLPYAYNTLENDRKNIYNHIETDIANIRSKIYCLTEEDEEETTTSEEVEIYNENDEIIGTALEEGETEAEPVQLLDGEVIENVFADPETDVYEEPRLMAVTGILSNHNDTGFSYLYNIRYEKDANDQILRMTFTLDDEVYKTYSAKIEVDRYESDVHNILAVVDGYYDDLIRMLDTNPKDSDTTMYNVNGFDYTCGAKFTKEAGSPEVLISILVDGIVENTEVKYIRSHYGEVDSTSGYSPTPLDDINEIMDFSEQATIRKIATFKGLTKDIKVFNKNGFSFTLTTVYTKSLEDHILTIESFIDSHRYGPIIVKELTREEHRYLIDDNEHSPHTYHGMGLAAIENLKTMIDNVPEDIYLDNFNVNGFNYNLAVKYSKVRDNDEIFVTKLLDNGELGDRSTLTFSVDSIDDIRVFGENLLDDLKQYLRDYTPANREYTYVPSDSELPFTIRTIYRKEVNNNNVYITTSLDGVIYGATTIKTFNINNINHLLDDVLVKEGLLKQQLEKTPRNYNEEYVVKNCVFKLDIKYEKAQDNLNVTTSVYLDDVRYGDARVERYDITNPKSISEYPNQIIAQLKSLLSDTIPEDIISTYSRGKYTFDMEILFSKSSGSDVITITYRVDSADVYSTSLSTGSIIGV